MLMRMIYSQPGVGYVAQPLDFWAYHPYRRRLAAADYADGGAYRSLDAADRDALESFFRDVFAGRARVNQQWNPFDPDFSFHVDRLVVKLLAYPWLIGWFADTFQVDVVYLVRHPVPTALSIIQRGWGCRAEMLVRDPTFSSELYGPTLAEEARAILSSSSRQECRRHESRQLEAYLLEVCLSNYVPLRQACRQEMSQRNWLVLTYEELVMRPTEMSRLICERLGFPDPRRMAARAQSPSKTALPQSKQIIKESSAEEIVGRWMNRFAEDDLERVQALLTQFCPARVYRADSPYPSADLCHLGPLS